MFILNKDMTPYVPIKWMFKLIAFIGLLTLPFSALHAQKKIVKKKQSTSKKGNRMFYGQASFYANKFHGRKTASGEIFSQQKLTAACNVLPLGTLVKVTNLKNGKTVIVKTNDRLHPRTRRLIDLTKAAARKLGFINGGLTRVKVEVIR